MVKHAKEIIKRNAGILIVILRDLGVMVFEVETYGLPYLRLEAKKEEWLTLVREAEEIAIRTHEKNLLEEKSYLRMTGEWDGLSDEEKKEYELSKVDWDLRIEAKVLFIEGMIDATATAWQIILRDQRGVTIPPYMYDDLLKHEAKRKEHEWVVVNPQGAVVA